MVGLYVISYNHFSATYPPLGWLSPLPDIGNVGQKACWCIELIGWWRIKGRRGVDGSKFDFSANRSKTCRRQIFALLCDGGLPRGDVRIKRLTHERKVGD